MGFAGRPLWPAKPARYPFGSSRPSLRSAICRAASATPAVRLSPPSPHRGSVLLLKFLCYRDLTGDPYLELHESTGGPPLPSSVQASEGRGLQAGVRQLGEPSLSQAGPGAPPRWLEARRA